MSFNIKYSSPKLNENSSVTDWQHYLLSKLPQPHITTEHQLLQILNTVESELSNITRYWHPVLRQLIAIHAYLFIIVQIDTISVRAAKSYDYSYYNWNHNSIYRLCLNKLENLIQTIDFKTARTAFASYTQEIASLLLKGSFDLQNSKIDWLYLYRLCWWNLLHVEAWISTETNRVHESLENNTLEKAEQDKLHCLRIHFQIRNGKDESAWQAIERLTKYNSPRYWLDYLELLMMDEQWERLVEWLLWMKPGCQKLNRNELKFYFQCWAYTHDNVPVKQQMVQTMRELLPHSYPYYTDYLLQHKQYTAWVDMLMSLGITTLDLDEQSLQMVAKADPHLLVPLYHQAVEKCILHKNRDAYRTAVYILKKLRNYYLQENKQQQWNEFIQALSQQYLRLRAFQEELKKGKLIS